MNSLLRNSFVSAFTSFQRNNLNTLNVRYSSKYFYVDDDLFGFTQQDKNIRQMIFDFSQKELAPKAKEIDATDTFTDFKKFWRSLGQLGVHGITVAPDYGGSGGNYLQNVIIAEEMSRASASIGLSYVAQSNFTANQINKWGNEQQKHKYLPKICSGEIIGALGISEPWAGSDALGMLTSAKRDGDHYIINGSKIWTTNGPIADFVLLYAKTDRSKGAKGITAFLVEKECEGFTVERKFDKLGMRGSDTGQLHFDNVRVHESNRLGEEGQGGLILLSGLDTERVVLAACSIGIMQAACDEAFEYVHTRKQFNQEIGTFQLMQGKIADMYTKLCSCKSYVYNVAKRLDTVINPAECASVFLLAAKCGVDVCREAVQCLGGNGYTKDYSVERLYRDAKVYEIGGGSNEIRKLVIARYINSLYLKQQRT